jgi:hypothetical protein
MTTRDRPLLMRVVLCGLCYRQVLVGLLETGCLFDYLRPGRAIRGKWRILDGKGDSVMDHKFGAPMVVASTCVD